MNRDIAINDFISRIEQDGSEFVDGIIERFDDQEQLKESSLDMLFRQSGDYVEDIRKVLIKVTCLNVFYSTRLNSNPPKDAHERKLAVDIETMARHISRLNETQGLQELIADGRTEAIELIRWIPDKGTNAYTDAYSFATKYCSWHNPEAYPIVDGYSKAMVYHLFLKLFGPTIDHKRVTHALLQDYVMFCQLFYELADWINKQCTRSYGVYQVKDIDKLFWYYAAHEVGESILYI